MREPRRLTLAALLAAALGGCIGDASPSPTAAPISQAPMASASPATPRASASAQPSPTATPEPALSLDVPPEVDERSVSFSVTPAVPPGGDGTLGVSVTNGSDTRIDELVLRWPTGLDATLFLAPFAPDASRIAEGGPPLVQDWSKWVVGPGERGEPAGTTSLGWGPIDAGATLDITIVVTRRGPGPVSFDFQVLAGNAILTTAGGDPAEDRVEIP